MKTRAAKSGPKGVNVMIRKDEKTGKPLFWDSWSDSMRRVYHGETMRKINEALGYDFQEVLRGAVEKLKKRNFREQIKRWDEEARLEEAMRKAARTMTAGQRYMASRRGR